MVMCHRKILERREAITCQRLVSIALATMVAVVFVVIFYALDARTGEELWRKKVDRHMNCLPVVADGIVYFGTDDSDLVLALEVGTAKEVWRFESARGTRSSPVIADKMLLIVDMDGSLYALH